MAAVVLTIAGCAEPATDLDAGAAPFVPLTRTALVDSLVPIHPAPSCAAVFCNSPFAYPLVIHRANANESVHEIHLAVDRMSGTATPVQWQLLCRDPNETCNRKLAEGEADLPFVIDLAPLALPPAAILSLKLEAPSAGAVPDAALGLAGGQAHVHGALTSSTVADAAVIAQTSAHVSVEGHSGPCGVEPNCTRWPGGSHIPIEQENNVVVHVALVMSWTATGPADEELVLSLEPLACKAGCTPPISVSGSSPIRIDAAVFWPDGFELSVFHQLEDTHMASPHGTRTPFQASGVLTTELAFEECSDDCTNGDASPGGAD